MKYRIIIETQRDGKRWYYVQKSFMLYFWRYLTEVSDISMCSYKIGWNTLEEAEQYIQNEVNYNHTQNQKQIVKREILNIKLFYKDEWIISKW